MHPGCSPGCLRGEVGEGKEIRKGWEEMIHFLVVRLCIVPRMEASYYYFSNF